MYSCNYLSLLCLNDAVGRDTLGKIITKKDEEDEISSW